MPLQFDNLMDSLTFMNYLFDNISSVVLIVDEEFKVIKINDPFKALFLRNELEALNQLCGNSLGCGFTVEENRLCGTTSHCGECSLRKCLIQSMKDSGNIQTTSITRTFYINGNPVLKHLRIKTKSVRYNEEDMTVITVDDVTELDEKNALIKEMADRDFLTKLFNRRYLHEYGGMMFFNAARGNGRLAVAMLDLDRFKDINDTYGHEAGDYVLVSLAGLLQSTLRKGDLVSRYGGEEFCVVMNVTKNEDALDVMEKIRKKIEETVFVYRGKTIPVTISCGVTWIPEESLEEMIRKADQMLYRAKQEGRNRVVVY
jgi:diguanylate cyclase (GGDEF)-like protein